MKASVLAVSCFFGILWTLAAGASIPRYFEKHGITRRDLTSAQVQRELGGLVSNTTLIFGPTDPRFDAVTSRWTDFSKPHIQVVIEPGRESDVPTIVRPMPTTSARRSILPADTDFQGRILQREQYRMAGPHRRPRPGGKSSHIQWYPDQYVAAQQYHHPTQWQVSLVRRRPHRAPSHRISLGQGLCHHHWRV